MTALTKDRKTDQMGTPDVVLPQLLSIPVYTNTTIYAGALVAINSSGYAVPASAAPSQRVVGRCERDAVNTTAAGFGNSGDIFVDVRQGVFFFNNGTGGNAIGIANMYSLCFASDDNTVNLTDNGGQWPCAGVIIPGGSSTNLRSTGTGEVAVLVGFPSLYQANAEASALTASAYKARNVATNLPGTFTVTAGVLLADANGALGAQDGVTNAVGDVILLPAGTVGSGTVTAANSGPWQLTAIGGASAKYAAIRPDWWANGANVIPGSAINVGGEGTLFPGSRWPTFAAASVVIGTGDPALYPEEVSQKVTLVSSAKAITNVPIRSASSQVLCRLSAVGGTTTSTVGYGTLVDPTPGALGTASTTVNALASGMTKNGTADTSDVIVTILN